MKPKKPFALGIRCLLLVFSCWLSGLMFTGSAVSIEMEDLMNDVLDDVRQETRQTLQQQIKTETREVIAEEQVIPSNSFSGRYSGILLDDGQPISCDFQFSGTNSGSFSGTCIDNEGSQVSISGNFGGGSFSFTLVEVFTADGHCPPGTESASGSGTISGSGEPGTVLSGQAGPTCGDSNSENFRITKV